jgi:ankyrin repeat protein
MTDEDEFLTAVRKNDGTRVKAILERSPHLLRMRTPNGTPVLTAAYHGAGDSLKVLVERTPEDALNLYEASTIGNARRLKTILGQSRVRVNEPNKEEGFTPLGLAAFFGHGDAVKVLLDHGAEIDGTDKSRFANTALDAAVAANHAEVVKVLLAAGAKVEVRAVDGYTPLHKAAANGNLEIVRMLLDAGADPKATREGGQTPIDDAREAGHTALVNLLEERDR